MIITRYKRIRDLHLENEGISVNDQCMGYEAINIRGKRVSISSVEGINIQGTVRGYQYPGYEGIYLYPGYKQKKRDKAAYEKWALGLEGSWVRGLLG